MLDFTVPSSIDDLVVRNDTKYYVQSSVPLKDVPKVLQELRSGVRNDIIQYVLENCDSLFSFLIHFSKLEWNIVTKVWDLFISVFSKLHLVLAKVLKSDLTNEERIQALNATKMVFYLITQTMRSFEDRLASYGKGKNKISKSSEDADWNWKETSHDAFKLLFDCLDLPLQKLWDPPCCEDTFIDLIGNSCFKALEDPGMCQAKTKHIRESIYHILGLLVKRFNYGFSCIVRMGQMLNVYEHTVSAMVRCVAVLHAEYDCTRIVQQVLNEITRIDPGDTSVTSTATKSYSQFITELGELVPDLMRPHINIIDQFLNSESYLMRNAAVSVLGDIIISCLARENMSQEEKDERDNILDVLQEYVYDNNAFVRSKVLNTWKKLQEKLSIPLVLQPAVLALGVDRLVDKSTYVRKAAVQLVLAFLEKNPFGPKLNFDELQEQLKTESEKLATVLEKSKTDSRAINEEKWLTLEPEIKDNFKQILEGDEELPDLRKEFDDDDMPDLWGNFCLFIQNKQFNDAYCALKCIEVFLPEHLQKMKASEGTESELECALSMAHDVYVVNAVVEEPQDVVTQKKIVDFLKAAILYVEEMNKAIPRIMNMATSTQQTDIIEAVDFFTAAYLFELNGSEESFNKLLVLVLSNEESIQNAVAEAFKKIYLSSGESNYKDHCKIVVNKLCNLIISLDIGQKEAFGVLMKSWIKKEEINANIIKVLFRTFTCEDDADKLDPPNSDVETTESNESGKSKTNGSDKMKIASVMLINMIASESPSLIKPFASLLVNEGLKTTRHNFFISSEICYIFVKVADKKADGKEYIRLPCDHEVLVQVINLLQNGINNLEDPHYNRMVESGINLIFKLSEKPINQLEEMFKNLTKSLKSKWEGDVRSVENGMAMCDLEKEMQEDQGASQVVLTSVPAIVASRWIFLAGHIAMHVMLYLEDCVYPILKNKAVEAERKRKEQEAKKSKSKKRRKTEDENEDNGTQAEDVEWEKIKFVCEKEVLNKETLFGKISELICNICSNPTLYDNSAVLTSAFLALSKMMMVSSEFCNKNMQLLITAMKSSPNEIIRSNSIIALGDIAFRFPNVFEPWTSYVFESLKDTSTSTRHTAVTILVHLVLNDMIKVKSQISELAICLIDEDPNISCVAKAFFSDFALKGNAVYNSLPDIISKLTSSESQLSEENFHKILTFVLSLISKDRQVEALVQKLFQRMLTSTDEEQVKKLAFCMEQMQYNDKSLQFLVDNVGQLGDKLHVPAVNKYFQTVITNITRSGKAELKVLVDELDARITSNLSKNGEDMEVLPQNESVVASSRKSRATGKSAAKRNPVVPASQKKKSRAKKGKAIQRSTSSSDSSSFSEN